jgi:hypothetical protein
MNHGVKPACALYKLKHFAMLSSDNAIIPATNFLPHSFRLERWHWQNFAGYR